MKLAVVVLVLALAACGGSKTSEPPKGDDASIKRTDAGVTLPPARALPAIPAGLPKLDLPATVTGEWVALGELLFWDTRLSIDNRTSCATCHDPQHGYAGVKRQTTAAGKPNLRRAPTLVNLAWAREIGWDGRYATLTEHLPAHAQGQLGNDLGAAMARIGEVDGYRAHFTRLGVPANEDSGLGALRAFVLTRYAGDAPWDRLERSPDVPADLKAGYVLFTTRAQCSVCHTPPLYTDLNYHRLGLIKSADSGRGQVDDTAKGAFKTPTLRGATTREAFFHDGSATSLDDAIDWHLAGGTGQGADPSIVDPALKKVVLTATERKQLGDFVRALSDSRNRPAPSKPTLP